MNSVQEQTELEMKSNRYEKSGRQPVRGNIAGDEETGLQDEHNDSWINTRLLMNRLKLAPPIGGSVEHNKIDGRKQRFNVLFVPILYEC